MLHFPTAQEVFATIVDDIGEREDEASQVLIEYATSAARDAPRTSVHLSRLQATSTCRVPVAARRFQAPTGWHRFRRIWINGRLIWDLLAKTCTLTICPRAHRVPTSSAASLGLEFQNDTAGRSGVHAWIVDGLPPILLARIVLCCDLPSLMRLAVALPQIGRFGCSRRLCSEQETCEGQCEIEEAMPRPALRTTCAMSWLSYARASLRWADICVLMEQASSGKTAKPLLPVKNHEGGQHEPNGRRRSKVEHPLLEMEVFSTATSPEALTILATGHSSAVRLWELPGLERKGMLRTKGCVVNLSLGDTGRLLVAGCSAGRDAHTFQTPGFVLAWSLSFESQMAPIWQMKVQSPSPMAFCGSGSELALAGLAPSNHIVSLVDVSVGKPKKTYSFESAVTLLCRPTAASFVGFFAAGDCSIWMLRDEEGLGMTASSPERLRLRSAYGKIVALSASREELTAATVQSRIIVWSIDGALLAVLDALPRPEELSCFASRAEAVMQQEPLSSITLLLALDEVVVFVLAFEGGGSVALGALHTRTGTPLPQPWHKSAPLEPRVGTARLLRCARPLHALAADGGLRWALASLASEGSSAASTAVVAQSSRSLS